MDVKTQRCGLRGTPNQSDGPATRRLPFRSGSSLNLIVSYGAAVCKAEQLNAVILQSDVVYFGAPTREGPLTKSGGLPNEPCPDRGNRLRGPTPYSDGEIARVC